MWDIDSHAALTSDVTEPSNLHFPNSCYRPSLGTGVVPEDFVDWPSLKQKAWDFVDGPYEGGESLKEICPAWWNATGCECECGNCSLLFSQCPVGFMLFRSLSLLCATKDPNIRLHELAIKKWGRGLLDLAKLRLGFADIIESGWPFFGILARIGDQLRLDGLSEEAAVGLLATRGAPTTRLGGSMAQGSTMCQQRGWRENNKYQEEVIQALEEDRPATLQASVDAGADKDACPLQRGAALAATADWLLREAETTAEQHLTSMSGGMLREVERLFARVEKELMDWASIGEGPYFFELMAVRWPVWRMMNRAGRRLLWQLSIDCPLSPGPSRWRRSELSLTDSTICAACPCPTQVEWASEARYVREYVEQLHEALFRQAACEDPRHFAEARRLAMNPQMTWSDRWLMQGKPTWRHSESGPKGPKREREGFVSVLFTQNAKLDQVLLHTEAIRTLAFSARKHCRFQRPYVVITDGPLPDLAAAALRADGLSILEAQDELQGTYGANLREDLQLDSWWMERGVAPTAIKLAVWNMTSFDRLLFLDADTLILGPVDELFELETFASGLNPYSVHGMTEIEQSGLKYRSHPGINTGVMLLQPSAEVTADMAREMASGRLDRSPIAEHLGRSDQPWLDAFWLQKSRRLGTARFAPRSDGSLAYEGCDVRFKVDWGYAGRRRRLNACSQGSTRGRPMALRGSERPWPQTLHTWNRKPKRSITRPMSAEQAHCVLPLEYDFFADYKAIRMHVWSEARTRANSGAIPADENITDIAWAVKQYVEDHDELLGKRGVKILHWPGEMRKPWHRWHQAVRSPWDEEWWKAHDEMCRQSSAACVLHCDQLK